MAALRTTTTMTTGNCGSQRFPSTSVASAPRPNAADTMSICGLPSKLFRGPVRPISAGAWDSKMRMAAACVKPVSTGDVTRFSNQPN